MVLSDICCLRSLDTRLGCRAMTLMGSREGRGEGWGKEGLGSPNRSTTVGRGGVEGIEIDITKKKAAIKKLIKERG